MTQAGGKHSLHRKALGRDKSSKTLTNPDLDKVIAAFRAVSDGGNLDAQIRQIEQPERRRAELEQRIAALAVACGIEGGPTALERYLANFLQGRPLAELDEHRLQQLAGILARRTRQRVRTSRKNRAPYS